MTDTSVKAVETKRCIDCGDPKDIKLFNRNQSKCIECQKIYKNNYTAKKKKQKAGLHVNKTESKSADGSWCGTGDNWIY